jgi:hypothetical protein
MPHIRKTEKEVWTFDELSDTAKDKARDWYRDGLGEIMDFDFLFDDFDTIAKIFGIEVDQRTFQTRGGDTRSEPSFHWGNLGMGGSASFSGSYRYAKGARKAIRAHAPQDTELHRISDELQEAQRRNFYRLTATIRERGIEVDGGYASNDDDDIRELLRDYMRWIYRALSAELEYRYADEQVDEDIRANEYDFTEEGKPA